MWVTITEDLVIDPNDISFIYTAFGGPDPDNNFLQPKIGSFIHFKNGHTARCPLSVQEVLNKISISGR